MPSSRRKLMPSQPNRRSKLTLPPSADPGALGETFVAQWLRDRGWLVLARRWHCRWGELDLVIGQASAQVPAEPIAIAFVEVKTRSRGNWDNDGALAITAQKRAKLWKTAQLFLAAHPIWAELPCQFDVALVCCRAIAPGKATLPQADRIQTITAGYCLTLQRYIPAAFTLD